MRVGLGVVLLVGLVDYEVLPEALLVGIEGQGVGAELVGTQVPFAEQGRGIARVAEDLAQRGFLQR